MKIGSLKKLADGSYAGEIKTLTMQTQVRMIRNEATGENAPAFRILAGEFEIGAAWIQRSQKGNDYISVRLDDPSFVKPIFAGLVETSSAPITFDLLWSRQRRQD